MRGKVLKFNGSTGLISGDDGKRYSFSASDLSGDTAYVPAGSTVDFEPEGDTASEIYVLGTSLSEKNRYIAAILACPFILGMLGLHKFYLGRVWAGIVTLVLTCTGVGVLVTFPITFIEMLIYLVKSDQSFYEDYVAGQKSWF